MLDDVDQFDADLRQLLGQKLRRAGAKERILMHDDGRLGDRAGGLVDLVEVLDGDPRHHSVAWREAERVFQAAIDDLVRNADIDDMRRVGLGRFLGSGERDGGRIARDDARHALLHHLVDFRRADFRLALAITQHALDLGSAERLDATGGVDIRDRQFRAGPALRSGEGYGARHRMDQADLHRLRLSPEHGGKSGDPQPHHGCARCKKLAPAHSPANGPRPLCNGRHHSLLFLSGRFLAAA